MGVDCGMGRAWEADVAKHDGVSPAGADIESRNLVSDEVRESRMVALPDPMLSGAIEGLVGAIAQPAFGWLVEKVRGRLAAAGPSKVDQAFAAALEGAGAGLGARLELSSEVRERILVLLSYREFHAEALRQVLSGRDAHRDQLLLLYRRISSAEGVDLSDAEIEAVDSVLRRLFDDLASDCARDDVLRELLADARELTYRAKLEERLSQLVASSTAVEAHTARAAAAAERTNETLERIERNTRPHKPQQRASKPKPLISAAEGDYLRELISKCDRLPLAENSRQDERDLRTGELRASLLKVYVDLATTQKPSFDEILDRLGVPEGKRGRLRSSLRRQATKVGGRGEEALATAGAGSEGQLLELLRGRERPELAKVPSLKPLLEDEARLDAALAPLTALEALCHERSSVLLGPPGSGKSTFVHHLAGTFAQVLLGQAPEWKVALGQRFERPLFPVRIVLSQWARLLPKGGAEEVKLIRYALPEVVSWSQWCRRLRDPGTIILFDGLDEVPTKAKDGSDPRKRLLAILAALREIYPEPKMLLTCRVRPYREATDEHRLRAWPELELAPLDTPRIERFCHLWYEETLRIRGQLGNIEEREHLERLRDHLLLALRQPEKKALREMAELPLLLTMLARVNQRDRLPEGRLALYRECTEQLLWEWEKAKAGDGAGGQSYETLDRFLAELPEPVTREQFEGVLSELAYSIHPEVPDGVAELPAERLEKRLVVLRQDRPRMASWAARVIDFLMRRDGLLVKRDDETFAFPHRSFQEFFAARRLVLLHREGPELTTRAAEEVWYEVSLLACAELAKEETRGVLPALEDLLAGSDAASPAGWRRALILGRVWLELKPRMVPFQPGDPAEVRRQKLEWEVPPLLERVLKSAAVPAARRLEAGQILDDLGILPRDLGALVEIPADRLGYAFNIGKYPVTNAEFRRFVEAGGYDREALWWTAQAKEEIERYWSSWPEGPRLWPDPKWSRGSFPVAGVSWHEAKAYCAWLTEELRQGEGPQRIGSDELVTLPTGAEWEAAARGEGSGKYPWGDEPGAARANTKESQLAATTPVHMYPPQALAPELFDLVGNVWEWLEDPYEDWGQCLIGGAFFVEMKGRGTAARGWGYRLNWIHNLGFRVVVVPSSRRNSEF